jgi:hypothetical protein
VAALALSALAGATGCFHVVSEEVRVRDPSQVSVLRADGTVALPAGEPGSAVYKEGVFGGPLFKTPYIAVVERDAQGNVGLRCDACADAWWTESRSPTVVTVTTGLRRPDATAVAFLGPAVGVNLLGAPASAVTLGAHEVDLRVKTCLLPGRSCEVPVDVLLATPRQNVIAIRRVRSPQQTMGAVLLAFGVVPMIGGATIAAGAVGSRLSVRTRALVATPVIALGAAFSAAGIWHLAAPVEERVIPLDAAGK